MIPKTVLVVVSGPFGATLGAEEVARAIGRGLVGAGQPEPDLCPIADEKGGTPDVGSLLERLDFDVRMHRARAVVLAEPRLQEKTLRGSVTFEIATRARQGGVPAYAVVGENALEPFDARILDLQLILEASSGRALASAGKKLAGLLEWRPVAADR